MHCAMVSFNALWFVIMHCQLGENVVADLMQPYKRSNHLATYYNYILSLVYNTTCDYNPCENGGTCQYHVGMYICTCHDQFVGSNNASVAVGVSVSLGILLILIFIATCIYWFWRKKSHNEKHDPDEEIKDIKE